MAIILLPVIDTESVHWAFNSPTNAEAHVYCLLQSSVTITSTLGAGVQLINDSTSPGASKAYSTDTLGVKGWHTFAGSGVTGIQVQGQTLLTGDVILIQGSNVTLTQSGQNITVAASGGGGGGGGGLTLVENKNIAANTTSVTFSGLDGDTDGVYLLTGKWLVNGGSSSNNLTVNPNGSSSSLSYGRVFNGGNDTGSSWLVGGAMTNGDHVSFTWHIHAKTHNQSIGQAKYFEGQCTQDNSGAITIVNIGGKLNDGSNNLISLDVTSNLSNGIGQGSQFTLYKFAQA
jgi:hypothetical protein